MNKKLLTSVSLLALLVSSNSFAHYHFHNAGDLKIGGGFNVDLQSGLRLQSASKARKSIRGVVTKIGPSANNTDLAFLTSATAYLGVEDKTKSGILYGLQVGLYTSTAGSFVAKDHLARTYAYFQRDDFGRFEIGSKKGASTSMALDGDSIAAGSGGTGGSWDNYISLNSYTKSSNYLDAATSEENFATDTKLIFKDSGSYSSNNEGARKVTYYTPKYKGFQFGLSFVPDEANRGGNADTDTPFVKSGPTGNLKNGFLGSLAYEKKIDTKQSMKVVLVGETGRLVRSTNAVQAGAAYVKQPVGFAIGAQYDYAKYSIAGSFGNKGKFKYAKQPGLKDAIFYTLGLSHQCTDKIKTSLTYFHSDNRNKLDIVSIGADYDWLPGIQPYAELNYITARQKWNFAQVETKTENNVTTSKFDKNGGKKSNEKTQGAVAIVGMRFNF